MSVDAKTAQNVQRVSELFEEHGDTIRTTIAVHVNNKSTIDDMFHDFFLALVKKPIPQNTNNVRAYLRRAAKNDVLDAACKTKSYHLRNRRYARMHMDRFETPAPDDLAVHAEDIRQLFGVVKKQLVQHEAEAIIQKYHHDRDTSEAADAMNIHKRSFSHYLCTGMKRLQESCHNHQSPDTND